MRNHLPLFIVAFLFCLSANILLAQPIATPATKRLEAHAQRQALQQNSLFKNIPFENIGPTVMSGRVVDLDVNPDNPNEFYVGYASGGLWHTTTNGQSFEPLFDHQAVMTIGDIAVDWKNNTIWVGTGENNSSRSSYAGTGMYKSTDGGKTWLHQGLEETQHIGRIILHPSDPNTLWVAALGHLYTKNEERGLYKSTDGGKTWKKTLFVNDNTGIIDMVGHPSNPDILYAAAWERIRHAWDFVGNGSGTGVYKSEDGGSTWNLVSGDKKGFTVSPGAGRIGLAISASNPDVIYACLDNQDRRAPSKEKDKKELLTKEQLKSMSKDAFLKLDDKKINAFLDANGFPMEHLAKNIKERVKKGELNPASLAEYLENANTQLFDTPVVGLENYRSNDGGKTWQKTNKDPIDGVVYSYGYYFGQVRIDPTNPERAFMMGVPLILTEDGGKTWKPINKENVHADHHALWINPKNPMHLINGNDGGLNISYNGGENWNKVNTLQVGQIYAVNVDMAKPYNVYCGFQDNGVWVGPSNYKHNRQHDMSGEYPYKSIMGGDGMQIEIDTRNNNIVYTGYQFGNYYRINKQAEKSSYITPSHRLGERPLRFNWQTPIHLSRHNQDILYFGSNKFHRSMNQGKDWAEASEDLTKGGQKGNVPYGTLTSIHESPMQFGLLYVGSDDGYIHVSKDVGQTWERISDALPQDYWVSRVQASSHQKGRVYASLNGYRWDNFEALNFVSEDYGKTWTAIGKDLPSEPVNVIKEDPKNENILYVGTDHGVYVSINKGTSFQGMNKNLPDVPVHDLVIHPRENDLIVGTHGRSIFKANVAHLQALDADKLKEPLYVYDLAKRRFSSRWGSKSFNWEYNKPSYSIPFYAAKGGSSSLKIYSPKGKLLKKWSQQADAGLNYVEYDLSIDEKSAKILERELGKDNKIKKTDAGKYFLAAGTYSLEVSLNGAMKKQALIIEAPRKRPSRTAKKRTP